MVLTKPLPIHLVRLATQACRSSRFSGFKMRNLLLWASLLFGVSWASTVQAQGPGTMLFDRFGVDLDLGPFNASAGPGATGGFPFDWTSFEPDPSQAPRFSAGAIDWTEADWFGAWLNDFTETTIQHAPAPGTPDQDWNPSGGEPYEVEGLYFDNDSNNYYLAIVTSIPLLVENDTTDPTPTSDYGVVDPRDFGSAGFGAAIRSGDLSISFFDGTARSERNSTEWHYNYGVDLTQENRDSYGTFAGLAVPNMRSLAVGTGLYETSADPGGSQIDGPSGASGDWYTSAAPPTGGSGASGATQGNWEHTNFDPLASGHVLSKLGDVTVNYYEYDFGGDEENGYPTYVYEITIPRSLFGVNDKGHGEQIGFRMTPGCRNDGNGAGDGTISLIAAVDDLEVGDFVFNDRNGNGVYEPLLGEAGINDVDVQLFPSGTPTSGTPIATTTTATLSGSPGRYLFGSLPSGDYYIHIPATEFQLGGTLEGLISSTTTEVDPDDDENEDGTGGNGAGSGASTVGGTGDENGIDDALAATNGISTGVFTLSGGDEPTGEDVASIQQTALDTNSNLSVDLGFLEELGAISGSVLADTDNDDAGEVGIANVTLTLTDAAGDPIDADGNAGNGIQPITAVTDGNGDYTFTNLPPGDYGVAETQPTGYDDVSDGDSTDPTDDAANADPLDDFIPVSIDAGETDTGNDFIEEQPGAISGSVLADTDNDDAGEVGIANVTLTLTDVAGDPIDADGNAGNGIQPITAVTDGNGDYAFTNLSPGDYGVAETQPTGYDDVSDGDSTGPTDDAANADPLDDFIPVSIDAGETDTGNDFIEEEYSSIGDLVWADLDGDGLFEPGDGEFGISNVTLELYLDVNSDGSFTEGTDTLAGSAVTDASGVYTFSDLGAGDYIVTITDDNNALIGYTATYDENDATTNPDGETDVALIAGDDHVTADFGFEPTLAGIYGTVYDDHDVSNDNAINSNEDAPLGGVEISLFTDPNGDGDPSDGVLVGVTYTDLSGDYAFNDVLPGNYVVVETDPSGFASDTDTAGANDNRVPVALAGIDSTGNDFLDDGGTLYNLSGSVYVDTSKDDSLNGSGEDPLGGVSVTLYADANGDGLADASDTVLGTATTLPDGSYRFEGLVPGDYVVVETDPTGASSDDDVQGAPTDNTVAATITNADSTGNDFLDDNVIPASIAGAVYNDTADDNALNGAGETPIPGVTVTLFTDPDGNGDPSDGVALATTVTDGNGAYLFADLAPGDYVVAETDPSGFTSDADTAGANDNQIPVALASGVDSTGNDFLDDGTVYAISGTVYDDDDATNNDAIGAEDAPMGGVSVALWADTDGNGSPDTLLASTVTAADGTYHFADLPPGDYVVVETDPSGFTSDADTAGANDNQIPLTLVNADSTGNDFLDDGGSLNAIGGIVYNDTADDDTLNGTGETPIVGVTVTLFADVDGDGEHTPGTDVAIASTVTGADGSYLFQDLPDGDYVVVETDPATAVSDDDADGSGANDTNTVAVALAGADDLDNHFLDDLLTGSIAGSSLEDTASDDTLNGTGEAPIAGVTMSLLTDPNGDGDPSDGTVLATTVTDTNGAYLFSNVAPGDYVVVETQPSGFPTSDDDTSTLIADGTDDWVDVSLAAGEDATGNDFLNDGGTLYALSGSVFVDTGNDDSLNGSGEDPLGGVSITLYADANGDGLADAGDTDLGTATTLPDGSYRFEGLVPGDYVVVETDPTGASSDDDVQGAPTDNTVAATITNADSTGNDFLDDNVIPASIAGAVYNDTADDNALNGAGETPIPGVTVTLFTDPDGNGDPSDGVALATTVTDGNGAYLFADLAPGDYVVAETDPSGFTSDADTAGANDNQIPVALASGVDSTGNDFLDDGTVYAISGTVYDDDDATNNDAIGAEDAPMGGVSVALWADTDGNGSPDTLLASTVTAADGTYHFADLPPGDYVVVETDPSGFTSDADTAGANDNQIPLTLVNTDSTGNDLLDDGGDLALISGQVRNDTDGDGDPGDSDAPVSGVTITLYTDPNGDGDPSDGQVLGSTTTLGDGTYAFDNLVAGDYVVVESDPVGATSTYDIEGNSTDNAIAVALSGTDSTGNDFLDTVPKPNTWADYLSENGLSGDDALPQPTGALPEAGNPDKDIYDNLLEYAFCLDPNDPIPAFPPFCAEVNTSGDPDTFEAVFYRPAGGLTDVTYCLEGRTTLPTTGDTTWVQLTVVPGSGVPGAGVTVTDLGNGLEEVRIADITAVATTGDTLLGFEDAGARGFIRLTVKLDTDGGGTDFTSHTQVQGWKQTDCGQNQCASFSHPWLQKEAFSGAVASVSGQELTMTGTPDLSNVLVPGSSYYLEILSGDNEGHRFDVVSTNASGVITLAIDTDLCAGPPFNTSTTLPATLAEDRFVVRAHQTVEGLFPAAALTPEADPGLADRLLIYEGGAIPWKVLYVDDPAEWKNESSGTSASDDVLAPHQGYFIHPKLGTLTVLGMGVVRANDFHCPLGDGYRMVAGGFPIDTSFTDRGLDDTVNQVTGTLDPATADQVHIWDGDGSVYSESFTGHFRLEGSIPSLPPFAQWSNVEDVNLDDTSDEKVFKADRSVFYYRLATGCDAAHQQPLPWTP